MWLGRMEEFPDCMKQGETLDELQERLNDICEDLAESKIPRSSSRG